MSDSTASAPQRSTNGQAPAPPQTWDPADFEGLDYYAIDDLLSDEARAIRDDVRAFITREAMPEIEAYAQRSEFPTFLVPKFA